MSFRTGVMVVVLWVTSLFAVATLARSQAYQFNPLPQPLVLSGNDLAFRVDGYSGPNPAGRLLIRIDGRWVEPVASVGRLTQPATTDR